MTTPVLYVRGDSDGRTIEPYTAGLEAAGVQSLESRIVQGAGEFLPIQAPGALTALLLAYGRKSS